VLSYRLMYFERDAAGDFQPPAAYPRLAIAAIATHDLPTLAGWWIGRDLQVREALGHFPSAEVRERQWAERAHDRARLLAALAREGLLPPGVDGDPQHTPVVTSALCAAAHRLLARSPALLVVAQLEDALGVVEQANLPGTTDEHPNWCRKLPEDSAALADDPRLAALGHALAAERPRRDRTA
jgi:4-alpha-glucanotransferase